MMSKANWMVAAAMWSFAASVLSAEPEMVNSGQRTADGADSAAARQDAGSPTADRAEHAPPGAAADNGQRTTSKRSSTTTPPRADRLDLDTTVVTGNRELPKVLYIVPWKKAQLGDLPAQPFNTLLDEILTPVDRDVFRREVTYFDALAAADASAAPGSERQ